MRVRGKVYIFVMLVNFMIDFYYFDKGVKKGDLKDLGKLKGKLKWLDVKDIDNRERILLEKAFGLHPLTSEDLINSGIRIKNEEFPDYLFSAFWDQVKQ